VSFFNCLRSIIGRVMCVERWLVWVFFRPADHVEERWRVIPRNVVTSECCQLFSFFPHKVLDAIFCVSRRLLSLRRLPLSFSFADFPFFASLFFVASGAT